MASFVFREGIRDLVFLPQGGSVFGWKPINPMGLIGFDVGSCFTKKFNKRDSGHVYKKNMEVEWVPRVSNHH